MLDTQSLTLEILIFYKKTNGLKFFHVNISKTLILKSFTVLIIIKLFTPKFYFIYQK
jgi:hypothetical protein